MKRYLLIVLLSVLGLGAVQAQLRTIGLSVGYEVDISWQYTIGEYGMMDVSANIPRFSGVGGTVTYNRMNPFDLEIPWYQYGTWNWYLGGGLGLGSYGLFKKDVENSWFFGLVVHAGIEYCFEFPMQLSLDYRPNLGFISKGSYEFNEDGYYGLTIGIRYLLD
jgi:hypothetical protein